MNIPNLEQIARTLLNNLRETKRNIHPEPVDALVEWMAGIYIGWVQEIAPEYSKEIVLLSKNSNPLNSDFLSAIRKLDPNRIYLIADDSINLDGTQHLLRRLQNKLTYMTPEQTKYMSEHLPKIYEVE